MDFDPNIQLAEHGYAVLNVENHDALFIFRDVLTALFELVDLSSLHEYVPLSSLNLRRLECFRALNRVSNWETIYASIFKSAIEKIIGPDVAIQNKLNLSIQMPGDHSSVLQMHTDSLAGQSAFELVCWLPLTHAYSTNSMYIFEPKISHQILKQLPMYENCGMNGLFDNYKSYAKFIDIKFGQALVFSPTLFHGNVVNETESTRISINCRVKNVFSPESASGERRLGSFYKLLSLSPLTKLALSYRDDLICFK